MIIINSIHLTADYRQLIVDFTVPAIGVVRETLGLNIYIGDGYLSQTPVVIPTVHLDQSAYPRVIATVPIEAISTMGSTEVILGGDGYAEDIFDGVFVVEPFIEVMATSQLDKAEDSIVNPYFLSMCLSHMIVSLDNMDNNTEVELLYLLINASKMYCAAKQIELCLGTYDRAVIIGESQPQEFFSTDLAPRGEGIGKWITSGIYAKR